MWTPPSPSVEENPHLQLHVSHFAVSGEGRAVSRIFSVQLTCVALALRPVASNVDPRPKVTKKKKKDVTLDRPTFPNGLKDFHEMTHAAEALSGLLAGGTSAQAKNEKTSGQSRSPT